jgi:hypothetical protein
MRAEDGGHLTRADQKALNQQENAVNREDRRMVRQDAAKNGNPPPPAPEANGNPPAAGN